mgnify:CR=1 FL=1
MWCATSAAPRETAYAIDADVGSNGVRQLRLYDLGRHTQP